MRMGLSEGRRRGQGPCSWQKVHYVWPHGLGNSLCLKEIRDVGKSRRRLRDPGCKASPPRSCILSVASQIQI